MRWQSFNQATFNRNIRRDTVNDAHVGNLVENLGNSVRNFIFANTFTPNILYND